MSQNTPGRKPYFSCPRTSILAEQPFIHPSCKEENMIQANPTITTLRRAWMVVPIALAGIVVLIALLFATAILFNYSYSFSIIAYLFLILAGGIITLVITIL